MMVVFEYELSGTCGVADGVLIRIVCIKFRVFAADFVACSG